MKRNYIVLVVIVLVLGYLFISKSNNKLNLFGGKEKITDGTYCFNYKSDTKDVLDEREIKLDIKDTKVVGVRHSRFNNNTYHISYSGVMDGTISSKGLINLVSKIKGSEGFDITQEERYQIKNGELTELKYVLNEDFTAKILRIDDSIKTNTYGEVFPIETKYTKVDCEGDSNEITNGNNESKKYPQYICFLPDENSSKKLMFILGEKDKTTFIKYQNGKNNIKVNFVEEKLEEPSQASYTRTYNEIIGSSVTGTYIHKHSGIYDYVTYKNTKSQKEYEFTNILDQSYIDTPCL